MKETAAREKGALMSNYIIDCLGCLRPGKYRIELTCGLRTIWYDGYWDHNSGFISLYCIQGGSVPAPRKLEIHERELRNVKTGPYVYRSPFERTEEEKKPPATDIKKPEPLKKFEVPEAKQINLFMISRGAEK